VQHALSGSVCAKVVSVYHLMFDEAARPTETEVRGKSQGNLD
jgi:hypothetical protein